MSELQIAHFETVRVDIRDEIKRRIEQRDKYSVQLTISLSVILAVAFSEAGYGKALIVAPLVSVYFTVLILYSYRVHKLLARYLREVIEPELAALHATDVSKEFENYYSDNAVPGIRKYFFMAACWLTTILPLSYLYTAEVANAAAPFESAFYGASVAYVAACVILTIVFWKT